MKKILLLAVGCVSFFSLKSMDTSSYPAGRPCGPVVFAGQQNSSIQDEDSSLQIVVDGDNSKDYRRKKIHFKKMGDIDKALLKKLISLKGATYITEVMNANEISKPYVDTKETKDGIAYRVKIPVILTISSKFYEKNRGKDNVTDKVYNQFYKDQSDTSLDKCTKIEIVNNKKKCLKCITKLYDRPTIERILADTSKKKLHKTSKNKDLTKPS